MAYAVELNGRQLSKDRGQLSYQVHGTDDASQAYLLAMAAAPVTFEGLLRQDAAVDELGNQTWKASVKYGPFPEGEEGDPPTWSFEITGQSMHITHSLETIQRYAASGTPPDHKGAIGVRRDGSSVTVEGCDVHIPIFSWEETHYVKLANITPTYIETLEELVATTNEDPFRIWAKGELLLLGVNGSSRGEKDVGLTFRFASSRTKTALAVGDITGITKEGHHHMWVEYEPVDDSNAKALTNRPKAVHVERVYDYGDFADLGLVDPWS